MKKLLAILLMFFLVPIVNVSASDYKASIELIPEQYLYCILSDPTQSTVYKYTIHSDEKVNTYFLDYENFLRKQDDKRDFFKYDSQIIEGQKTGEFKIKYDDKAWYFVIEPAIYNKNTTVFFTLEKESFSTYTNIIIDHLFLSMFVLIVFVALIIVLADFIYSKYIDKKQNKALLFKKLLNKNTTATKKPKKKKKKKRKV